jgi:hypothetical protein
MIGKPLFRATVLALSLAIGGPAFAGEAAPIIGRQLSDYKIGSSQTTFGSLEFLGGLELVSRNRLFGSWSSIRMRPDGIHFVGVLDTGHWLTGGIVRDAKGRLSDLTDVEITPMKDRHGDTFEGKGRMDAEGVALGDNRVIVSFEQDHRVETYPDPGFTDSPALSSIPILIPRKTLRGNRGIETVEVSPATSPLKGGVVIVSERSLDDKGNRRAAILTGPLKGSFLIENDTSFDVTDGTFLPDGDLVLLERRFNMAEGLGMRLRRFKGSDIKPGALIHGEVVLDSDFGNQIDNMEGVDAFQGPDGKTHLVMVSDDNHSILQRTLMLEFRLTE